MGWTTRLHTLAFVAVPRWLLLSGTAVRFVLQSVPFLHSGQGASASAPNAGGHPPTPKFGIHAGMSAANALHTRKRAVQERLRAAASAGKLTAEELDRERWPSADVTLRSQYPLPSLVIFKGYHIDAAHAGNLTGA